MKKIIITLTLSIFILVTSASVVFPLDRAISLPTIEKALANGKIQPRINISKKKSSASPWVYADLKLEAIDSNAYNINVSGEIMQNMYRFFANQGAAIYNGRMCIILNNGYVVDRDTFIFRNMEATRMLSTELRKSFYKGDTLCRVGFLYEDNVVERDTYWKLIDTIDLPAGSTHTLNKKYTVGSSKSEQIEIGQTFGLRLGAEVVTSAGVDGTFGSVKVASSLTTELNKTSEKTFTDSREITSSFESATNVTYAESDNDRIVLRYQLVDSYKTDQGAFDRAVGMLTSYINKDYKLAKFSPAREGKGIEVPSEEIFDVSIDKENIGETGVITREKTDDGELTLGEIKDKEEELNKKEEELNRKEEALNEREEALDQREEELDKKEEELEKKEESIEKKEESVEKKDEAVSQKEESVAQKEKAIDIKNSAIIKKESAIDKKEDAIDKKEEAVDKKEDAVDEKEDAKKKAPPKGKVETRAKGKEKPKLEEDKDKKEEFKDTRRKAVRRKEPPKKPQPQTKAPTKPQKKVKKPPKQKIIKQQEKERLKRKQAVKRKQQQNQPQKDRQKQNP